MVKRLVRLADHVFRLALPYGDGTVNSYLFEGERGYTVLDTGTNDELTKREWTQLLEGGLKIEKVVITHMHPDHIGLAPWFQQELGIPVLCSQQTVDLMKRYTTYAEQELTDAHAPYRFNYKYDGPELSERQFYRFMGGIQFQPSGVYRNHDRLVLGDEEYEALWTPGHAPDHYCFWHKPSQILIAADMMFADTAPVVPFWMEEEGNPLGDYFLSIDLIESYPAELVLPGHDHVIHDLSQRARDIRNGHHFRMQQILGHLVHEPRTAGELCADIYGTDRPVTQELLEFYTTLARLVYLQADGFITTTEQNGKIYFQRT